MAWPTASHHRSATSPTPTPTLKDERVRGPGIAPNLGCSPQKVSTLLPRLGLGEGGHGRIRSNAPLQSARLSTAPLVARHSAAGLGLEPVCADHGGGARLTSACR